MFAIFLPCHLGLAHLHAHDIVHRAPGGTSCRPLNKLKGDSGAVRTTRNAFLAHRSGLGLALVGAAEDVELAALLRLALNDVDATEVDVDAARPPVVKFFFQNQII